jgi:hypothetical protein
MSVNTSHNGPPGPKNLRIMIVSTPKTGNMWIKHLLAQTYGLPIKRVGPKFDPVEVVSLGPRWIAHQHYGARADVIDYGHRNNIVFVTTIRHPCDALVSHFHHLRNFGQERVFSEKDRPPLMLRDGDSIGEHTAAYVRDGFATFLDISLGWLRSGRSHVVHYEDLKRDPVGTIQELTTAIQKISPDRIKRAVEACSIDRMRKRSPAFEKFIRRGTVGGWRSELPEQIIEIFRHTEPFPAQFAELGYSLDKDRPVAAARRKRAASIDAGPVHPTYLDQVHATARVEGHWPIAWPTWPKGLWPKLVALVQKVIRRLLRWYIDPIVEQQNRFNSTVVQALNEMWWELSHQQEQILEAERKDEPEDK